MSLVNNKYQQGDIINTGDCIIEILTVAPTLDQLNRIIYFTKETYSNNRIQYHAWPEDILEQEK